MKFHLVTIFPEMFDSYLNESLFKRAQKEKIISVKKYDIRSFTDDKHHKVDDRPFGGGPGMVLKVEPIYKVVSAIKNQAERSKKKKTIRTILFSTRGNKLDAKTAKRLARYDELILICGRYEGIDERVAEYVADEEISIGDYILSGGELPALVLMESVSRFIPGFLGKEESLEEANGSFPTYTRPEKFMPKKVGAKKEKTWGVPNVLLSGNHKKIEEWRKGAKKGFTLIELLVVIAILAVLAVVVVLTLNPAGLLQESRDNNRVSDMATINTAINLYASDATNLSLGSSSVLYVSIPDPSATSTAGDQCQGLSGLPTLPAGYAYQCAASSTYRLTNGTGWIPINFSADSFGTPLGSLPVDPTNTTSSGLYYEYLTNGSKYEVTASFESQKYLKAQAQSDGGIDPTRVEEGSSLSLLPGAEGLVGYWPFNEGAGTVAQDGSGGGRTCSGITSWTSSAKVGNSAVVIPNSFSCITPSVVSGAITYAAWIDTTTSTGDIIGFEGYSPTWGYSMILTSTGALGLWFQDSGSTWRSVGSSPLSITNQWHFVAATNNGVNTILYLDGQVLQSFANPYTAGAASNTLSVGSAGWSTFHGNIDDLRMYDRALSSSEIQSIYNSEK